MARDFFGGADLTKSGDFLRLRKSGFADAWVLWMAGQPVGTRTPLRDKLTVVKTAAGKLEMAVLLMMLVSAEELRRTQGRGAALSS